MHCYSKFLFHRNISSIFQITIILYSELLIHFIFHFLATDSNQTDKKVRTAKRKQKSETKIDSPKTQRSTRSRKRHDTQDTEMKDVLNEDVVEVKGNKNNFTKT